LAYKETVLDTELEKPGPRAGFFIARRFFMFVLTVTYTAPMDAVEPHVAPHMEWVAAGYERGWFLASGRKNPRTGGVIFAKGTREELEAFVAEDPFVTGEVAAYEITEVLVTKTAPGLEGLMS
jgi:uncharacterized protein YciI